MAHHYDLKADTFRDNIPVRIFGHLTVHLLARIAAQLQQTVSLGRTGLCPHQPGASVNIRWVFISVLTDILINWIGMLEHVGAAHLALSLAPNGICAIIMMNRWINKYIFPGGYLLYARSWPI